MLLGEPVKLAQVPLDGRAFVVRQFLPSEPTPAQPAEQVSMRARRDEMCLQDGMHLVLDLGPMPNDLVATGHKATQAFGILIGEPNLR